MLTHSDQHVPEFMQATRQVQYEACGRRFRMHDFVADSGRQLNNGLASTVSARLQSWLDADGTAIGYPGYPSLLGSAVADAGQWWRLDDYCGHDADGPLWYCQTRGTRQLGSINMQWAPGTEGTFGVTTCGNGQVGLPCEARGYVKHWGGRYGGSNGQALPITLNGEVTGALGGFGWHVRFDAGSPRVINISRIQVPHDTKLVLSIAYPVDVDQVTVTALAPSWCLPWAGPMRACSTVFVRLSSVAAVRASLGNTYHLANGILTLRIVQPPKSWTGRPDWTVPVDPIPPFVRNGIRIPRYSWHATLEIKAVCTPSAADHTLCMGVPSSEEPSACAVGWQQTAYDQCCRHGACVDPEGAPSPPMSPYRLASSRPPPSAAPAPLPPPPLPPSALPPAFGSQCLGWCAAHPQPWSAKCTFRACSGCAAECTPSPPPPPPLPSPTSPPLPPGCQSWCEAHPQSWEIICRTFAQCGRCAPCFLSPPPPGQPPLPLPPPFTPGDEGGGSGLGTGTLIGIGAGGGTVTLAALCAILRAAGAPGAGPG